MRARHNVADFRFAREFIYIEANPWCLHVRVDSSPQFNKDYLVSEVDVVDLGSCFSARSKDALRNIKFTTRIMPLQILGRKATNTVYKYRALLRALSLEVGKPDLIKSRTYSILHDMGVESKLAMVPDFDETSSNRAFKHALPLHDLDHGLHIVMQELDDCWCSDLYKTFQRQLNALAKYFSKSDNLERFKKFCIFENPQISGAARKKSIAQMFDKSCPTLVKHRWEYLHEVLCWVTQRYQFLGYLHRDPQATRAERDSMSRDDALSELEADAFKSLYTDKSVTLTFCAMCEVVRILCRWGHGVVGWSHGCWCHPSEEERKDYKKQHGKHCPWSGRRLIELACGHAQEWIADLGTLTIEQDQFAHKALTALTVLGRELGDNSTQEAARKIASGFVTARRMVHSRFAQLVSFLAEPPWSLSSLLQYCIVRSEEVPAAVAKSRAKAGMFLSQFDSGKCGSVGDIGLQFFKSTHRAALCRWASGQDVFMNLSLFRSLIGYATSLNVMQRLEAKHHLVQAQG
jgi:hypothetical protein